MDKIKKTILAVLGVIAAGIIAIAGFFMYAFAPEIFGEYPCNR